MINKYCTQTVHVAAEIHTMQHLLFLDSRGKMKNYMYITSLNEEN